MYLHVDNPESSQYEVINLDTGTRIGLCQWANDETGEYCVLVPDLNGDLIFDGNELKQEIKKGNIKLQKK